MGVKSCSRPGCENIMCDIYIQPVGYICYDCKKEFQEWLSNKHNINWTSDLQLTEHAWMQELIGFMGIKKLKYDDKVKMGFSDFFHKADPQS